MATPSSGSDPPAAPRQARKPGSNLGRAALDWESAFVYYASLPVQTRSYQVVADHFGVSVRTVEKHGRSQRWRQRLRKINAVAAEENNRSLGRSRAEHVRGLIRLIDASLDGYAEKLEQGAIRMSPGDLERLHRLRCAVQGEADDPGMPTDEMFYTPPRRRSPEHLRALLTMIRDDGLAEAFGLTDERIDRFLGDGDPQVAESEENDADGADPRRGNGRRGRLEGDP